MYLITVDGNAVIFRTKRTLTACRLFCQYFGRHDVRLIEQTRDGDLVLRRLERA